MPVLFHEWVGPFGTNTFAILFDNGGGSWRLVWDQGDEYRLGDIVARNTFCYKIPANRIAEIKVVSSYDGVLGFSGQVLPQVSQKMEVREQKRIPGQCGVTGCSPSSRECPPENEPTHTKGYCVGGQLVCGEPEFDKKSAAKSAKE